MSTPIELIPQTAPAAPRARGRGARPAGPSLYSLRPGAVWAYLCTQPASFWLVNVYLFWEYVRPQSIYTFLEGPPWTQITLILAAVAFVAEGGQFRMATPADRLLMVFTGVVLVSCVFAYSPETAFSRVWPIYIVWVLIYLLIANVVNTEKRFLVFMLAFLLYSFKMSQHGTRSWAEVGFAFQGGGVSGAPGWFQNSGEFGVQMAMFIPLVAYWTAGLRAHMGRWMTILFYVMILTAVTGTIGSSSRGAMIAAAAAIVFMVLKTRKKVKGLLILALLAGFVQVMLPDEQRARFEAIGDDKTSTSRKEYWAFGRQVVADFPVLGIGFGNWPVYYERHHGYRAAPHNILVEVTAELGYTGLAAFVALAASTFVVNRRTRRRVAPLGEEGRFIHAMANGLDAALIGYLVSGQFVTVTYYPFFWINLAMTVALHNAANDLAGGTPVQPRTRRAVPHARYAS